jgi:hypothetical protein
LVSDEEEAFFFLGKGSALALGAAGVLALVDLGFLAGEGCSEREEEVEKEGSEVDDEAWFRLDRRTSEAMLVRK